MTSRADDSRLEKELERTVCLTLEGAKTEQALLENLRISQATSADVRSVRDLVHGVQFDVLQDTSDWRRDASWERSWKAGSTWLLEIAGGQTPDIVLRSKADRWSGENRILIEVKREQGDFQYERECFQMIRYFLYLLATTRRYPLAGRGDCKCKVPDICRHEIRRAVLAAAPSGWFARQGRESKWRHFMDTYRHIAKTLDVTIGEIHLDG